MNVLGLGAFFYNSKKKKKSRNCSIMEQSQNGI